MNANELADELKEIALISDNHTKIVLGIAETMLRQQQAEIEAMNLSNEEIGLLTTDPRFSHIESPLLLEFARAILRKAQK